MNSARCWVLGVALGVAAPAAAADPATVVVHGLVGADDGAVRAAWEAQSGPVAGVRFVPVDEVFPPDQPLVFLGDAQVRACAGEVQPPSALARLNDLVVSQLTEMEYASANGTLREVAELLPCLGGAPDPDELGRTHFLRGVVAFEVDGPATARQRFVEGLLVSPFLQWNDRYPPTVKPSFDEAVKTAVGAARAFVSMSERVLADGAVWLDGLAVDSRTRTTTVWEGTHLLQWKPADQPVRSMVVQVDPGQSLELLHRDDAVAAALSGRADPALTEYLRGRVLAPVERGPVGALAVAEEGEVFLFHMHDVDAGWTRADTRDIDLYRANGRRLRAAGLGTSVAGVALAIIGAVGAVDAAVSVAGIDAYIRGEDSFEEEDAAARFRNAAPYYQDYEARRRLGLGLSITGGVVALAGVPMTAIGAQRALAHGVRRPGRAGAAAAPSP